MSIHQRQRGKFERQQTIWILSLLLLCCPREHIGDEAAYSDRVYNIEEVIFIFLIQAYNMIVDEKGQVPVLESPLSAFGDQDLWSWNLLFVITPHPR